MGEINKNLKFSDEPEIIDGQKYYRIICIKRYKDYYAKRYIEPGEIGGYFHEKSLGDGPEHWIDENKMVGAPRVEYGRLTLNRKDYKHSNIRVFTPILTDAIHFWNVHCGVHKPHEINAVMYNSKMMLELVDEIYSKETLIDNKKNNTDFEMILLWIYLGMLMEGTIKLHSTVFRNEITIDGKTHEKNWLIESSKIIPALYRLKHLSLDERHLCEKINNSRNRIHFLNHEHILGYDEYLETVDHFYLIFEKLLSIQKKYVIK